MNNTYPFPILATHEPLATEQSIYMGKCSFPQAAVAACSGDSRLWCIVGLEFGLSFDDNYPIFCSAYFGRPS